MMLSFPLLLPSPGQDMSLEEFPGEIWAREYRGRCHWLVDCGAGMKWL